MESESIMNFLRRIVLSLYLNVLSLYLNAALRHQRSVVAQCDHLLAYSIAARTAERDMANLRIEALEAELAAINSTGKTPTP